MAAHLGMSEAEFFEGFTRPLSTGEISLREKHNHDCVFLTRDRRCDVYPHRPAQCRTWPFWRAVLHTPDHWARAAGTCPGMNNGPLHTADRISEILENDGTSGAVPVI